MVEEVVVGDVDEELGRGGVGVARAGHGDRVTVVLETVGGFVFDRSTGFLLDHARKEAAALDHEAADDAVEETGLDVFFEVFAGLRSVFVVELDVDHTLVRGETDHGDAVHAVGPGKARGARRRRAAG